MANLESHVTLILDRSHGARALKDAQRGPIWIIKSEQNAETVRTLWREYESSSDHVTEFTPIGDSAEENCIHIIPDVLEQFSAALEAEQYEEVIELCSDSVYWETPRSGSKRGKTNVLQFLRERKPVNCKYMVGWEKKNDAGEDWPTKTRQERLSPKTEREPAHKIDVPVLHFFDSSVKLLLPQ